MPIFEYRCSACGHRFEDLRSQGEADDPGDCPKCGKPKVERMMSSFATAGCALPGADPGPGTGGPSGG